MIKTVHRRTYLENRHHSSSSYHSSQGTLLNFNHNGGDVNKSSVFNSNNIIEDRIVRANFANHSEPELQTRPKSWVAVEALEAMEADEKLV